MIDNFVIEKNKAWKLMDRSNGGGGTERFCCHSCTLNRTLDLCCISCHKMAARSLGGGCCPTSTADAAAPPEISRTPQSITSLVKVERKCGAAGQDEQLRTSGAEGRPEAALKVRRRWGGCFSCAPGGLVLACAKVRSHGEEGIFWNLGQKC